MQTIHPTKDRYSRGTILGLGILMLAGVNGIFVLMIYMPEYLWIYMIGLLVLAWIYWRRWKTFSTLEYRKEGSIVSIYRNAKKMYEFDQGDIIRVDADYSLPLHRSRGYHVSHGGLDIIATKSRHDLVYIYLPEGRSVMMSDWGNFSFQ